VRPVLVVLPAVALIVGFAVRLRGFEDWADLIWDAATALVLTALLVEIVTSLRRGEVGLDIVAALSMAGALAFGEHLAAVVVALMYAGGQYLESFAERRAGREMTALLERVPRSAIRHRGAGLEEIPLAAVEPGDRLLIRRGEVVPVDGVVAEGLAVLDRSALTGESVPVQHHAGEAVLSGSTNAGDAFDLSASRRAAESTYAGIVRLVAEAQGSKAPMARLADRYALVFLAVTVLLAGGAWLVTGDPIRALSVLVVATPCPLILAVPVAIVSGTSRAAKIGVLVKGGQALETLSRVRTLVIDKTGTLTHGSANLVACRLIPPWNEDEVLRLAASVDQASTHVIAEALVAEARARGLTLSRPQEAVETPGEGVEGLVEGRRVAVGGLHFLAGRAVPPGERLDPHAHAAGAVQVGVAVDGHVAGVLVLADRLREGTGALLAELRALGIERIVLATGDRPEVAREVARDLAVDEVRAGLTPDEKLTLVASERPRGPVLMAGDGVNDAPALAAADLGVAMGARGAAASAEAADVVILVDRLDRIAPAIRIAQRARGIALQSVSIGLGLSFAGMIAAALGYLAPVEGALIQEAIDVAVILNALRALGGDAAERP
jgi:heavy metal translocating P-type ATPase